MAKSVVLVVSFHVIDQEQIKAKLREYKDEGNTGNIFDMDIPGLEGIKFRDAHVCNPRMREDQKRFAEILYNHACVVAMEQPELIYIVKK